MSKYKPLPKPIRISEQVWPPSTVPVVSISCIAYNHKNFITEAIESFLMQETTFPVEILIHDDASSDGTAEIIKRYEQRFPLLIKPIYQKKNQYSKGVRISWVYQWPRVKGEFVALCEGDDYWVSQNKLEKQVKFLRENEDAKFVFHNSFVIYEAENKISLFNDSARGSWHDFKTLIEGNFIPTASKLTRTENLFSSNDIPQGVPGDWIGHFMESVNGKFYYHPDIMSAYRIHPFGVWSRQSKSSQMENSIKTLDFLNKKTGFAYDRKFSLSKLPFYQSLLGERTLRRTCELSKTALEAKGRQLKIVLWGFGSLGRFVQDTLEDIGIREIIVVDRRKVISDMFRTPEDFLASRFDRKPLILLTTMFWLDIISAHFSRTDVFLRDAYVISPDIQNY
jgi:glycosyltransferase involved in cell wall biosynthesis